MSDGGAVVVVLMVGVAAVDFWLSGAAARGSAMNSNTRRMRCCNENLFHNQKDHYIFHTLYALYTYNLSDIKLITSND